MNVMTGRSLGQNPSQNAVSAVLGHLQSDDAVTRSAAARALGRLGDQAAAPVLVEALLDEDPDVRADAMASLVALARPEDAPEIRRSLEGDPLREVKIAAIEALARLQDCAALTLLTRLAEERAEDAVNWENTLDVWDDWLDVQVAAIQALAAMRAPGVVPLLCRLRADPLGQDLDTVVFRALAGCGAEGALASLIGFAGDPSEKTRRRALAALGAAAPERLAEMLPRLMADDSVAVRLLAVRALGDGRDADDDAVSALARRDPSPVVRRAAVAAFGSGRPALAQAALSDPDEDTVAAALDALPAAFGDDADGTLAANAAAWAATGGVRLATAGIARVAMLGREAALPVLAAHARDADRPLQSRIEALQRLGGLGGGGAVEALGHCLADATRQIRAAALGGLAQIARHGGEAVAPAALSLLIAATEGRLVEEESADPSPDTAPRLPAGKAPGLRVIRTTREGKIVFDEVAVGAMPARPQGPSSTLEALDWGQRGIVVPARDAPQGSDAAAGDELAGDGLERDDLHDDLHGGDAAVRKPKAGGRRRVAVTGPDAIGADLRLMALRHAAGVPSLAVAHALAGAAGSGDRALRRAAMEGLALQAEAIAFDAGLCEQLRVAIGDGDPVVAVAASRAALAQADPVLRAAVAARAADGDAPLRALALTALAATDRDGGADHAADHGAERALILAAAGDPARQVRDVALRILIERGDATTIASALGGALSRGHADTVAMAYTAAPVARDTLLRTLTRPASLTARRTALTAIAEAPVAVP
ncbi:MAG: HEAT repeat domain-containing protein [Pseudomonadota bacterium]